MNPLKKLVGVLVAVAWPLVSGAAAQPIVPAPPPHPLPMLPAIQPAAPGGLFAADREPAPDSGWLGIQLAPVPAAVASQLRLDDRGVMVRNIFKDSPADRAGLERYDVIVRVDGRQVERGMEMFSRHVQGKKPGDRLELTLFRGGEKTEVTVRLAEPPQELDERDLKYEDDPDVAHRRWYDFRGKILRPGPDGWILEDLGKLPDLPEFRQWLEEGPEQRSPGEQTPAEPEGILEGRRVDPDGQVLQVRRNEDGTIEVRRYKSGTPEGQIETESYDSLEELRDKDPQAAELLDEMARPRRDEGRHGVQRWRKGVERWQRGMKDYQDALRQYQDAVREYMKKYRWDGEHRPPSPPAAPRWREWSERFLPEIPPEARPVLPPRENQVPPARFEVNPDGSITAHVDDGPTQLTMTFPDEKSFQERAPKLYERYKETLQRMK